MFLLSVYSQYICHLLTLEIKNTRNIHIFLIKKGSKALILRAQGQGTYILPEIGMNFFFLRNMRHKFLSRHKKKVPIFRLHLSQKKEIGRNLELSRTQVLYPPPDTFYFKVDRIFHPLPIALLDAPKLGRCSFYYTFFFFTPRSKPCSFRVALFISGFVDIKIYL